ncbi:methyltransferase domain-containing protein [Oscillatoria amoena NRMC-F 0135]|nr:methyltransferase domain-containing protein [Oscillatoria amoena NRMC-F 0135]
MNTEYIKILPELKAHYANGGNMMEFLRNHFGRGYNNFDDIICSYDLQSGTYIEFAKKNQDFIQKYSLEVANILEGIDGSINSILEAGVGEATTFANMLGNLKTPCINAFGVDISWSRVHLGNKYLADKNLNYVKLGTGNIFNLPFKDDSIDIVYTSHAIEPNGGVESKLVAELYRVAAKYLVLFEPAYDFADGESKKRMEKNGYCIKLWDVIKEEGYEVVEHRLMNLYSNPLNPTGLTIIKKKGESTNKVGWACPITNIELEVVDNVMTNDSLGVSYPIIKNIPCLLPENAILTSCFNK